MSSSRVGRLGLLSLAMLLVVPFGAACPSGDGDTDAGDGDADAGGDGDGDGDGDGGTGGCGTIVTGRWGGGTAQANDCLGMAMSADLTVDATGCVISFSNWNMVMSVPGGAILTGQDLDFTGEGWDACTGVLAADGRSLTGECTDAPACTFSMALVE